MTNCNRDFLPEYYLGQTAKKCSDRDCAKCTATIPIRLHWIREVVNEAGWPVMNIYCRIGWRGIVRLLNN